MRGKVRGRSVPIEMDTTTPYSIERPVKLTLTVLVRGSLAVSHLFSGIIRVSFVVIVVGFVAVSKDLINDVDKPILGVLMTVAMVTQDSVFTTEPIDKLVVVYPMVNGHYVAVVLNRVVLYGNHVLIGRVGISGGLVTDVVMAIAIVHEMLVVNHGDIRVVVAISVPVITAISEAICGDVDSDLNAELHHEVVLLRGF